MHRKTLLELLERYIPTEEEIANKAKIIAFVKDNPNCFERSLETGHITSSAWLLNQNGDKALLTHHKKLNAWLQLGGHCDGDPNILNVAIKEAQEESGMKAITAIMDSIFDLDVHFIRTNSKEMGHYHYDLCFLLQAQKSDELTPNDESNELRWISKDIKALPTGERAVLRMFEKWLAYESA